MKLVMFKKKKKKFKDIRRKFEITEAFIVEIETLRLELNLKVKDFCKLLRINMSSYYKYMNGTNKYMLWNRYCDWQRLLEDKEIVIQRLEREKWNLKKPPKVAPTFNDTLDGLDKDSLKMLTSIAKIEERTVKAQARYMLKKEIKKYAEKHYNQLFLIKKEIK